MHIARPYSRQSNTINTDTGSLTFRTPFSLSTTTTENSPTKLEILEATSLSKDLHQLATVCSTGQLLMENRYRLTGA